MSGRKIPCRVVERRPGDVAVSYADPSLAGEQLGWRAEKKLEDMCRDAWRWQSNAWQTTEDKPRIGTVG